MEGQQTWKSLKPTGSSKTTLERSSRLDEQCDCTLIRVPLAILWAYKPRLCDQLNPLLQLVLEATYDTLCFQNRPLHISHRPPFASTPTMFSYCLVPPIRMSHRSYIRVPNHTRLCYHFPNQTVAWLWSSIDIEVDILRYLDGLASLPGIIS